MHIETLKTFRDVVDAASLSRAAKANRVTQSAVSQQIHALEARYGKKLLERSPRKGAHPTEAGRVFYDGVKALLERFEALERELRGHGTTMTGRVRVATVYSVGLHTLPPAMKKFVALHPRVSVQLEYRRTDQIYEACIAGSIDLGIVAIPTKRRELAVASLGTDELLLVTAPKHLLSGHRGVSLADLDGVAFVAFDRDIPTRKLVDRLLRQHGASVRRVMELDNVETIKRSVEAGLGVSILPAPSLVTELRTGSLVRVPLKEGPITRPVGAIYRRRGEPSAATRAFLATLEEELARMGGTSAER